MAIREIMKMDTSVETYMNLDKSTAAVDQIQSDKSTQTASGSSNTENLDKPDTENADNNGNNTNEHMDTEVDKSTVQEKEVKVKEEVIVKEEIREEESVKSENGNENSPNETAVLSNDNQETSDKMDEASSQTCDKRKLPDESETECKKIKTEENLHAFI